uniref:GOLD domain-containing protein n=1 Tax=Kalanchoe fedtschenkoi TaxID=63787 RepID=A0A7N0V6P6_KALFE
MIRGAAVVLLSFLLLLSYTAESVRFDLQSGHTKCIAEDIKSNSMTVGKYSVVNPSEGHPLPDSHKLTVRVTSAYGNNYHNADLVESGQFAFTAPENGDYMACFWAPDHKPEVTISVDFEWKSGMEAKDWTNVAKKGSVDAMELELKRLMDTVTSIHEEMFYLRDREEEMQELNKSTNSQMAVFSFLSLVVCLSVAGLQFWHLKTFFEKKKLI